MEAPNTAMGFNHSDEVNDQVPDVALCIEDNRVTHKYRVKAVAPLGTWHGHHRDTMEHAELDMKEFKVYISLQCSNLLYIMNS